MYLGVILISLNEAKFNNDSEQLEFGAHAARNIDCEIIWRKGIKKTVQDPPTHATVLHPIKESYIYTYIHTYIQT